MFTCVRSKLRVCHLAPDDAKKRPKMRNILQAYSHCQVAVGLVISIKIATRWALSERLNESPIGLDDCVLTVGECPTIIWPLSGTKIRLIAGLESNGEKGGYVICVL